MGGGVAELRREALRRCERHAALALAVGPGEPLAGGRREGDQHRPAAARRPRADESLLTGSIALAQTAADVLLDAALRAELRARFEEQFGRAPQG